MKFLNKEIAKRKKNASHATATLQQPVLEDSSDGEDSSEDSGSEEAQTASKPEKVNSLRISLCNLTNELHIQAKVRTKYDRMFERKNQNILSEHFNKMIDHEDDAAAGGSDDDFITLKRADHELSDSDAPEHDFASKRKAKMANSKKAIAKYGARVTMLVFDDEGQAYELYQMKCTEEVF